VVWVVVQYFVGGAGEGGRSSTRAVAGDECVIACVCGVRSL
jgi:hypothetical protein